MHGGECPSSVCPMKAARTLVDKAGSRGNQEALVVTLGGGTVRKDTMVAEIVNLAAATGAPSGKYSGDSLGVTGAQRMASAGVEFEKIKVFGRWTSNEALRYEGGIGKQVERRHRSSSGAELGQCQRNARGVRGKPASGQ